MTDEQKVQQVFALALATLGEAAYEEFITAWNNLVDARGGSPYAYIDPAYIVAESLLVAPPLKD